uniref:4-coumarate--CoA ligase n=1 Tax=Strigomonas galati TaxID=1003336 RepID=T1YTF7_9TRYP|nr:4-coumarate--CoA ligase [Strigomonas galati]
MLRFSPRPATACLCRLQRQAVVASTSACSVSLRHASSCPDPNFKPLLPTEKAARQYTTPEGWRVYGSIYPSILKELDKHPSLYRYMTGRWARTPDRTALIQEETKEKMTFQQLHNTTERFAQVLYHYAEIRKGDVVCLMALNTIYYPVVSFSTMRLGAVITTSAAMTTVEALCHQLEASKAKIVITTHAFLHTAKEAVERVNTQTGRHTQALLLEDLLKLEAPAIPSSYTAMEEAKPEDVVYLPFSSGTTGSPKGTQLTNRNLTANALRSFPPIPMSEDDLIMNVLPMFHIFGFAAVLINTLVKNAPQVIMSKYSADAYLNAVQEYKATMGFIAPPIAVSLAHRLADPENRYDFSSMRDLSCGASSLSEDIVRRLVESSPGLRMGQGLGMTEMSPTVTYYGRFETTIPMNAVGMLGADTEIRVVKVDNSQQSGADKSAGIDADEGKEGEIWLRGPTVMKGYLNPEDTAKCMQDGWYRSGDLGYVDKRNLLYISGRLKELIKYKGFQVAPPEIESELVKHPWVKDCIVIGVPDQQDISFENPRALVVLVDNLPVKDAVRASDEIYRYMMRKMPPHKRLHGGVRIVDEIMKNATGKLMRRQQRTAELEYMKEKIF